MTKSEILIITRASDNHADDMVLKLQELGHEPVRLNTDDIPLDTALSFFTTGQPSWKGSIILNSAGRAIDMHDIRSIWWRRPGEYFGLPPELSEQEREFAKGEIDHILRGLWSLVDCYWISHPDHIRQASWKLEQLQRAARYGFEVPRTLITNNPDEARAFYAACNEQMIFKVLTDSFLGAPKLVDKHPDHPPPEPREVMTTLITAAELEQIDSIRLVPCMFQEYIPKRVELRVTIIGDEIFAAEIDSQALEGTRVDWRNWAEGGFDIPYRAVTLPAEIAERCLALVRSYRLNFSAMDLILTPDGRYVFLENNPNGQFIWVEKLVPELEMTAALATCLIRGENRTRG